MYEGYDPDYDCLENDTDFLEHYGRKGMKWYQHLFGDFQAQAKYNRRKRLRAKAKKRKAKEEKKKAKEEKKAAEKAAENQKRKAEIAKNPKSLYKHRDEFTKEEIDQAMQRFEWERRLRAYDISQMNDARQNVQNIVNMTKIGIDGYNQVARIYNSFSDSKIRYVMPTGFMGELPKEKKPGDNK